ncbi:hypothetical protein M2324_003930 [Rhodovulum sulfidophilum]|uniref:hypothetical protein n=1 Tax=Rhodovulum sulfidophilum TaxID=35806 RepID=UPI0005A9D366|nr:hypothetical protein [Rhodovulum sulfidophilum]ANB35826.1 hypothetical protein A6W98_18190 [Rhodovulum sulfidophilum DSM 1374]ANB39637.1 hypothetical protein A6024_17995 [Rhodovulum sulfidophilum]MCW2305504.1 hypothetical protein [Rhodovulum sulfidophilum]
MMRIDRAMLARAEDVRFAAARDRLKARLLAEPQATQMSDRQRRAFVDWIDGVWAQVRAAPGAAEHPVTLQRAVLIEMTRPRWSADPLLAAYVDRMVATPGRAWPFEAGVTAVWRNVLAARLMRPEIVAFIAQEEKL